MTRVIDGEGVERSGGINIEFHWYEFFKGLK